MIDLQLNLAPFIKRTNKINHFISSNSRVHDKMDGFQVFENIKKVCSKKKPFYTCITNIPIS